MNKGSNKTGLYIGIIVAFVVLLVLLFNYLWPSHDWKEIYKQDSKEPYGGYVFAQLLKTYTPGKDFVVMDKRWDSASVITDTLKNGNNYVFLGTVSYMDSLSASSLLKFVDRGNNALIVAPNAPYDLLLQLGIINYNADSMKVDDDYDDDEPADTAKFDYPSDTTSDADTDYDEDYEDTVATDYDTSAFFDSLKMLVDSLKKDTTLKAPEVPMENGSHMHLGESGENYFMAPAVNLNFTHPKLKDPKGYVYQYVFKNDTINYYWDYLVDDDPNQTFKFPYTKLGTIGNDHFNFIKIKHGKGTILLHCTPLAFSNFYLLDTTHLDYVQKVMSHLNNGNTYWDEYTREFHFSNSYHGKGDNKVHPTESPLRFILSQKSLKWAWYLILALVVLYTLFQMKRKQRVIPVLNKNVNTSIEFAETVSRLYFQQNDHRKLALQQMKLFLSFIRNRYYINTSLPESELVAKISAKSGVASGDVSFIIAQYKQIEGMPEITEHILIEFYKSLENFYHSCK